MLILNELARRSTVPTGSESSINSSKLKVKGESKNPRTHLRWMRGTKVDEADELKSFLRRFLLDPLPHPWHYCKDFKIKDLEIGQFLIG